MKFPIHNFQLLFGFLTVLSSILTIRGQSCGLISSDGSIIPPTEFHWPYPLPDNWEPDTHEFWSSNTVNVVGSVAMAHPHTKYISAFRHSTKYTMKTKTAFLTFLSSEDNMDDMIHRRIRFNCSDGSEIDYTFDIPVEVSDKEVPTFQRSEYAFKIRSDWPPNVSMNQGQFLIVSDLDADLANARLTFDTVPRGVLQAIGFPLWSEVNPPEGGPFNYRVELYYRPFIPLEAGAYEFMLIANSRKLTGHAKLIVEVE